jgi:hypothetical protein
MLSDTADRRDVDVNIEQYDVIAEYLFAFWFNSTVNNTR